MTPDTREGLLQAARAVAADLSPRLVAWQRLQGRHHLPWQGTRDPYRVWLSEIMLQQTQVSTVLGYFDRFLQRFPTVVDLADAQLDEVLALWAGLGYYSRARNLHRCAQAVRDLHGGRFPPSATDLQGLPGIGRSTAAAVAAFCFEERTPILDGNVKRVLTRVLGWPGDLASSRAEKALWEAAEVVLPQACADMPAWTQGLMDLGATLCTPRRPDCAGCPWSDLCVAREHDLTASLPVKTRKLKRSARENWCLWVEHERHVWLVQRPDTGVWAGLWTLPLYADEALLVEAVGQVLAATGDRQPVLEPQPSLRHVLTHLDWDLHPRRLVMSGQRPENPAWHGTENTAAGRWVPLDSLRDWGLPTPMRRWLDAV